MFLENASVANVAINGLVNKLVCLLVVAVDNLSMSLAHSIVNFSFLQKLG